KKRANMAQAAKLIGGLVLKRLLPPGAREPPDPDRGANDNGDHEDGEAGIDEVHPHLEQHGAAPGQELDVVEYARDGGEEDEAETGGVENREPPPRPRPDPLVDDVEDDL